MLIAILFSIVLILLNAFFVAAEFAFVKVRTTQLEGLAATGGRRATLALHIAKNVDPYLSATQLGITLASLALGWIGEPAVAKPLELLFAYSGLVIADDTLHLMSFGIAFSIISFSHIVIGEVAPKSFAIAKPTQTALFIAIPLRAVFLCFYPFLAVLNVSAVALLKLVNVRPVEGHGMSISAEELRNIAQHSTSDGTIPEDQGALIDKVFKFSDRVAREIMVPRNRMVAINSEDPIAESIQFALDRGHTRYPLYKGEIDQIVGILHLKDILHLFTKPLEIDDLTPLARQPLYVPETALAQHLLREFQLRKSHLAIVVDEHGGIAGVITLEDTLEELVGEIQDEFDVESPLIEEITGGYSIDGGLLLDELVERLDLEEIESYADTVSGYVMEQLGRIAKVGDEVSLGTHVMRVAEMDRLRIVRVVVRPLQARPVVE